MTDRDLRDALLEWTLLDARSAAWGDHRKVRDWRWSGHISWPIGQPPTPVWMWDEAV
jgi:hypothetical protein